MNIQNYERLLFKNDGEKKWFSTPWASLVIRNISNGSLVKYSSLHKLKKKKVPIWISLKLLLFRENNQFFSIFTCNDCECMSSLATLRVDQNQENLQASKCLHSKAADKIMLKLGDYDTVWNINTQEYQVGDECFQVTTNTDLKHKTLLDSDTSFLALFNNPITGKLSILTTLNGKTKSPYCQLCERSKCACFWKYKKLVEDELYLEASSDESDDGETDKDWYWDRRNEDVEKTLHYEKINPLKYGYNATPFHYPIHRDPFLFDKFQQYITDNLVIPDDLVTTYNPDDKCSHGNAFSEDELVLLNPDENITIYYETSETIMHRRVYGRKTIGTCKCLKQFDGHPYLLWNLGTLRSESSYKFVHYSFLLNSVHNWSLGTPYNSTLKARELTMKTLLLHTSLTVHDFDKAMNGFCFQIKIPKEEFTCHGECDGDTPPVLVGDGICVAPTSRKVDHIEEFKPHEDCTEELPPSTKFKDRTFLIRKSERQLLRQFVLEEITTAEFLESDVVTSANGLLIREIIVRLDRSHVTCPDEYKDLLSDLGKPLKSTSKVLVSCTDQIGF